MVASVADLGRPPETVKGVVTRKKICTCDCDDEEDCSCCDTVSRAEAILHDIDERRIKKVIRKSKVVRKVVCPPGKKAQDGKCVRMSPQELRNRKLSQKRGARKRKAKKARANISRAKSLRRRASIS